MKLKIENIKQFFINLPGKIKYTAKLLYDLPHSGKYLLLSLVLFLFFLLITFPYDMLIKKKIYAMEGKSFRSVDIEKFDFSVIGETYIDNINIVLNTGNEVYCKNTILNIALNPVTLFINNKIKSDFQFDSLRYVMKDFDFMLNVNGNIDITLNKQNNLPQNGLIKIILSDSIVKLTDVSIPGPMGPLPLKIESISIQSGNIDSVITNGVMKFSAFKLTGNDLNCEITGTVDLLNDSKIDLTVNIDSDSAVLDQYKDLLTSLIRNNVLALRITGNLAKPELKIINPAKNEN